MKVVLAKAGDADNALTWQACHACVLKGSVVIDSIREMSIGRPCNMGRLLHRRAQALGIDNDNV